jgi:hypothetical protein
MTKPRLQAEPAYENSHLVARDLLERIGELLTDLPAPGGQLAIDWPLVGMLAGVNERLASVVAMLDGSQR